jgi:transaldolase
MPDGPLQELREVGQSVWIDFLARDMVRDGELAEKAKAGVAGVTSNPTIFQGAMSEGDAYDDQIRQELDAGVESTDELFWRLAITDVQEACDVLKPVFEETDHIDGRVSLEVDPRLAHDVEDTLGEARRLRDQVDRPNLLVKIPATEPGLEAIRRATAEGISVNVTLIFSLERHKQVMEAFISGLEERLENGEDIASVASVASFFVSRVDTEADKRLEEAGNTELQGKLAVANAKLAYQAAHEIFSGERWEKLKAAGARPQRCLWASTSTKNENYPDLIYVENLIGPDTVNTMPPKTIDALLDHGTVKATLAGDPEGAQKVLDDIAAAGVDYDDVVKTLEDEGVQKFTDSFDELLKGLDEKRSSLVAA